MSSYEERRAQKLAIEAGGEPAIDLREFPLRAIRTFVSLIQGDN